jgi:ATP-dependent helicase HrpA
VAIESIAALEAKVRRRDLVVDDETLFSLYDARVGTDVVSARHFDAWWKKTRRSEPDLLTFSVAELMTRPLDVDGFPDVWRHGAFEFPLRYAFSPGSDDDGVTVRIPVAVLNQVRAGDFSWHVPGFREELVTGLLRSLPKPLRRHFVPAPDVARKLAPQLSLAEGALPDVLARELWRMSGEQVASSDFDVERLPDYLRMRFEVVDAEENVLAAGRSLPALAEKLGASMRAALHDAVSDLERDGARGWEFGELPETVERVKAGMRVLGFPALIDQGDSVGVRVLESSREAATATQKGLRRLLLLNVSSPAKALARQLPNATKLALSANAPGGVTALLDDCLACALDALISGQPVRDGVAFERLLAQARTRLPSMVADVVTTVVDVLGAAREVQRQLKTPPTPEALPAMVDMKAQLVGLVHRGFVTQTGAQRLHDLPRYLAAIARRLDKLPGDVARDRARMWEVEQASEALAQARHERPDDAALDDVRWLIEELRVSLFAQTLGTAQPVSLRRVLRAIEPAKAP